MLIVEGSDHVGKTTFCKKLVEELGKFGEYHHMSKPGPEWDYYHDYFHQLMSGRVYDRFHFGAFVYGAMLNLHPVQGWSLWRMCLVTQFIHVARGVVVVIYDSCDHEYEQRIRASERSEMFSVGAIVEANKLFQIVPNIDEVDYVFDVKGGTRYPTDVDVKTVAAMWRLKNGLA